MNKFFYIVLAFSLTAVARPLPKLNFLEISDSFGPRISSQSIPVNSALSARISLVGERAQVGRQSFEYFLESAELIYNDGTTETIVVNQWFHGSITLKLQNYSEKMVQSLVIRAKHDDLNQSSPSHKLSIYTIEEVQ